MALTEINATATQIEDFIKSFLWEDMCRELEAWRTDVMAAYPTVESLLEKGRIDGRLEALGYFLTLPHVLLEARKEASVKKSHMRDEEDADNSSSDDINGND